MKYYRSWPKRVPSGRSYVVDQLPRLTIEHADLSTAEEGLPDEDFTLLEWDIALALEQTESWEDRVSRHPDRVIVAPYTLYPKSTALPSRVCAHRVGMEPNTKFLAPERNWNATCDAFGFGMVYLPRQVVERFLSEFPRRAEVAHFTDTNFSLWHQRTIGPVELVWTVRPIHLHY